MQAIADTVTRVVHTIDAKHWDELRALYADSVRTDYTSLFGGAPQQQTGSALIEGWKAALAKVATHHMLGPVVVGTHGPKASAACHVRALHHAERAPSGQYWEVLGHYRFELEQAALGAWLITSMTLITYMQAGNAKLLEEANAAP
ncbi:MAG TPA: nuclear transport factor 2 family protein [Polyangiaceae bacterium]|nr:nuclear transport factor 2 family protein [Polyangiaceae bacterium]